MSKLFGLLLGGSLLVAGAAAEAAPTLLVSGGELTGAQKVDVGGTLYDVAFVDGTCAGLFNGCNEVGDFTFTSLSGAQAAAQALLDTVFVDGPAGNFDSQPDLTAGCGSAELCYVVIPYGLSIPNVIVAENNAGSDAVYSSTQTNAPNVDYTPLGTHTWALFTLSPPDQPGNVPEPASLLLLGLGLVGLGVSRSRVMATGRSRSA